MNTLLIYQEIGNWGTTSEDVAFFLQQNKSKDIQIRINSPGGSVTEGIAIYNLLKAHSGSVEVVIDSLCASIATIIALAGDDIKMNLGAIFMIHNPSSMVWGESEEMRKEAEVLDKFRDLLVSIYMTKFSGTEEEIIALMDAETWLADKEAMNHGFIDSITQELKISASIKYDLKKYFNSTPSEKNQMTDKERKQAEADAKVIADAAAKAKLDAQAVFDGLVDVGVAAKLKEEADAKVIADAAAKAKLEAEAIAATETPEAKMDELVNAGVKNEMDRRAQITSLAFEGQEELVKNLIDEKATVEEASKRIIVNQKELAGGEISEETPQTTANLLKALNQGAPVVINEGGGGDPVKSVADMKKEYENCKDPKQKSLIVQKMSKLSRENKLKAKNGES